MDKELKLKLKENKETKKIVNQKAKIIKNKVKEKLINDKIKFHKKKLEKLEKSQTKLNKKK